MVDESTEGLRIFARAADGTLWTWLSKSPGTWATGTPLGGSISPDTAVGATRTSDGALHVIVNGKDHQAWYRRNLTGKWDAHWTALGGVLRNDVDLAVSGPSEVVAATWGTNRLPYYLTRTTTEVTPWTRMSNGAVGVAPALAPTVSEAPLTAVSRTTSTTLVSSEYATEKWAPWSTVG